MSRDVHSFTHDDVQRILEVIDRLEDVEIQIETSDLKLHVKKFAEAREAPTDGHTAALNGHAPAMAGPGIAPLAASAAASTKPASVAGPMQAPAAAAPSDPRTLPGTDRDAAVPSATAVAVRAPMLGTFYRAPAPTEPPYVEIGHEVKAADPVCIIEVMKLYNTVEAGIDGTVVRVDCESGAMVEYDQPLFWIEPK